MIRSMTGYGNNSIWREDLAVSAEIRSVNHRFLDLHVRLPREFGFMEPEIVRALRDVLSRGRIDLSLTIQTTMPPDVLLNIPLARNYMAASNRLQEEFQFSEGLDLKTLLGLPGVVQSKDTSTARGESVDQATTGTVMDAVRRALSEVMRMREQEGQALAAEVRQHMANLRAQLEAMDPYITVAMAEYQEKLLARLAQILPGPLVEPQRLAQEVALVAEKTDITEELARLRSHLDQFSGLTDSDSAAGKEMDFLIQEMQREVNTALSKTTHIEITRIAIAMKAGIERLREQVQNVE